MAESRISAVMAVCQVDKLGREVDDLRDELETIAKGRKEFQYAYVVHDRDISKDGTPAEPHVHIICKTAKGSGLTFKKWSNLLQLPTNFIERWQGHWATAVGYIQHLTDDAVASGKAIYYPDEITANFDIEEMNSKAQKTIDLKSKGSVNNALQKLDLGLDNFENLADSLIGKDKVEFLRQARLIMKYKQERAESDKGELEVYFIYGDSGTGKTRLAREMLKDYEVFTTGSAKDPFASFLPKYNAVIFDDARFKNFDAGELLKFLDAYNPQRIVPSRYTDKNISGVKRIVITMIDSPLTAWRKAYGKNEPYAQLKRRLTDVYKVKSDGTFETESSRAVKSLPWSVSDTNGKDEQL